MRRLSRRILQVALPLARPAVAAGVALVLMETLADFGVTSYFGIQTFTTGIYKAWLSMDNRTAAAQLSTMLLVLVMGLLLQLEHRAQRRMRFAAGGVGHAASAEAVPCAVARRRPGARLAVLPGAGVDGICCAGGLHAAPPGLRLVSTALGAVSGMGLEQCPSGGNHGRPGCGGGAWCWPSPRAAVGDLLTRGVVRLASVGYAVPGAVIVVGLLLPVGWLQDQVPNWGLAAPW